jgi:cation diffusion facilitator family transporter
MLRIPRNITQSFRRVLLSRSVKTNRFCKRMHWNITPSQSQPSHQFSSTTNDERYTDTDTYKSSVTSKLPKIKGRKEELLSDSDFLQEVANKQGEAIRATQVGAFANIVLAASKGSIGMAVGSTGLIADGVNSLGDLLCDLVVWYTVVESRKGATPERPWGAGKLEPIGALTVGALLLATGVGIGYTAFGVAIEMAPGVFPVLRELPFVGSGSAIDHIEDILEEKTTEVLQNDLKLMYAAIGVSAVSVGVKEVLYRYTLAAGKKATSSAVIANAYQHRSDAAVSTAVMGGLFGKMWGFSILDPLAGLLVAGVIVKQAYRTSLDSLKDLSDMPANKTETNALIRECMRVPGIRKVVHLQARQSGPYLYVEAAVGVDGDISASAAHRLAEMARKQILRTFRGRVSNAVIHVDPLGSTGLGEMSPSWAQDHDHVEDEVKKALETIYHPDGITAVTETQVYYQDDGTVDVKVDVRMSPHLTIKEAHALALKARLKIEAALPGVGDVDVDLELDE